MAITEKTERQSEAQKAMTSLQLADGDGKKRREQKKKRSTQEKLQADALIQPV